MIIQDQDDAQQKAARLEQSSKRESQHEINSFLNSAATLAIIGLSPHLQDRECLRKHTSTYLIWDLEQVEQR